MNKVILVGRMGKDPELKTTENAKIANFSLATSEGKDKTDWHNVVAFNRNAEIITEYAAKGSLVGVEGKLQTRTWKKDDGSTGYATEVVAFRVELLGGGKEKSIKESADPVASKMASQSGVIHDLPF